MSDFQTISDLIARRGARKQAERDRFSSGLRQFGQNIFQQKQEESARQYQTGEREATQQFQAGEAAKGREFQAQQADIDRQYQALRDKTNNDAAFQRAQAQIQAQLDQMERANQMEREQYGEGPQTWTDPNTGRTYSWSSNQEFEMARRRMESDLLRDEIRLRAELSDVSPEMGEQIRAAYEFAKNELLWDAQAQTFRDLSSISDEELRTMFENAIFTGGFEGLDPAAVDRAYALFTGFMNQGSATNQSVSRPPSASASREPTGDIGMDALRGNLNLISDVSRNIAGTSETAPQTMREVLNVLGNFRSIPNTAPDAPEGVERRQLFGIGFNEQKLWNALTTLSGQMEQASPNTVSMDPMYRRIQEYIQDIEEPGKSANYDRIEDFIKSLFTQPGMIRE